MLGWRSISRAALVAILVFGPGSVQGQAGRGPAPTPRIACEAMAGRAVAATRIGLPTRGARVVSAVMERGSAPDAPAADYVPPHCRITAAIAPIDPTAPDINFAVAIPQNWNGAAYQIGGNGANGFIPNIAALNRNAQGSPVGQTIPPNAPFPIAQGYATYGGDSGHGGASPPGTPAPAGGGGGGDNSWVANRESYRNLAFESVKKTHDAAEALIADMYGSAPRLTYFGGESQGGREALMAVARYPDDYEGVISSVPLTHFAGLIAVRHEWIKAQFEPGAWVSPAKARVVAQETLRICDPMDGLADGVISNYEGCNRRMDVAFTPNPLAGVRCAGGGDGETCLSDKEIATVNSWRTAWPFGFAFLNGEMSTVGIPAGSEDRPGWAPLQANRPDPARPPQAGAAYHLRVRLADTPTRGDLIAHSKTEMREQIQELSALIDQPLDWSRFLARGGKLIMYSSANDYLTNPRSQMHLYNEAVRRYGRATVERSVRYYVNPFAGHNSVSTSAGTNEPLPRHVDMMGTLQAWVERRVVPPDALQQTLMDAKPPYAVLRARPLCRYPSYPRYRQGDPKLAASYACAAP